MSTTSEEANNAGESQVAQTPQQWRRTGEEAIPSAALMVSRAGERVYEGYFGRYIGGDPLDPHSYRKDPEVPPATPDTLYDLASLTKPLATAALVMDLVGTGELALSSSLGELLRGLPEATAELTVDSLLAHSSGLPAVPELWKHVQPSGGEYASGGGFPDPDQIERARNALYQIEPVAEPGRRIIYSCTGYLLLGEVVKALSGEPLARRFTHFSGSSTASFRATVNGDTSFALGFLPPARERERSAPTEADRWRGRRIQGEVHDENAYALGGAAGNAGLFGTLRAVHTHILRLWGPLVGAGEEEALLPERDVRKMATVRESLPLPAHLLTGLPGSVERRGLGVRLAPKEWQETTGMSEESFGHTGFTGTSFWVDPPRQLVIVALTNRLYYGREASEAGLGDYRRLLHRRVLESFR